MEGVNVFRSVRDHSRRALQNKLPVSRGARSDQSDLHQMNSAFDQWSWNDSMNQFVDLLNINQQLFSEFLSKTPKTFFPPWKHLRWFIDLLINSELEFVGEKLLAGFSKSSRLLTLSQNSSFSWTSVWTSCDSRPRRSVTDPRDGRKVALKKMPNVFQNLVSCKRVFRELRMLCFFKHDNVSSGRRAGGVGADGTWQKLTVLCSCRFYQRWTSCSRRRSTASRKCILVLNMREQLIRSQI